MHERLYTMDANCLDDHAVKPCVGALESGMVVYFPNFAFSLDDFEKSRLLTPAILDGKHKNVGYDPVRKRLGGYQQKGLPEDTVGRLGDFMQRFADFSRNLVDTALPGYQNALVWGRTSFRPACIEGRASSERKDDTRLHVDSFPATPVHGRRILRVFSNINPDNLARVWELGEPYAAVFQRFAGTLPRYGACRAAILHWIKATKTRRTAYDHYQLHLHDAMKLDGEYQQTVQKDRIHFPAQSTWMVFTDSVSHAALSGQHLMEQTFYVPVEAMENPALSPLHYWQQQRPGCFARP